MNNMEDFNAENSVNKMLWCVAKMIYAINADYFTVNEKWQLPMEDKFMLIAYILSDGTLDEQAELKTRLKEALNKWTK